MCHDLIQSREFIRHTLYKCVLTHGEFVGAPAHSQEAFLVSCFHLRPPSITLPIVRGDLCAGEGSDPSLLEENERDHEHYDGLGTTGGPMRNLSKEPVVRQVRLHRDGGHRKWFLAGYGQFWG